MNYIKLFSDIDISLVQISPEMHPQVSVAAADCSSKLIFQCLILMRTTGILSQIFLNLNKNQL